MKPLHFALVVLLASCGDSTEEAPGTPAASGPALASTPDGSAGAPPLSGHPGELPGSPSFIPAEGWVEVPPGMPERMREFRLPGDAEGQEATIKISFWPNGVGPLERNLQRWIGEVGLGVTSAELTPEQRWMTEPNGFLVTSVHLEGALQSTGHGGGTVQATGQDALLAAFIEKPGAASVWVVKTSGPAATITKHKDAFKTFIAGI